MELSENLSRWKFLHRYAHAQCELNDNNKNEDRKFDIESQAWHERLFLTCNFLKKIGSNALPLLLVETNNSTVLCIVYHIYIRSFLYDSKNQMTYNKKTHLQKDAYDTNSILRLYIST